MTDMPRLDEMLAALDGLAGEIGAGFEGTAYDLIETYQDATEDERREDPILVTVREIIAAHGESVSDDGLADLMDALGGAYHGEPAEDAHLEMAYEDRCAGDVG